MESSRKVIIAIIFALFFLTAGTLGYMRIEGFSPLDAFYMTVITISTVGFGEINELTGNGRIFTILLILLGVGSLAFAAHAFTESIIVRASSPHSRKRAMKKKIDRLSGHYIICGHGRMGAAAASQFRQLEADFVVIESSEDEALRLEGDGCLVIHGDATRESVLLTAGIKKAGALLALLDSDPENLFTVLTARELNPTLKIIARTEIASSESRMLRAGADSVVSPYASAGKRVADKIIGAIQKNNVRGELAGPLTAEEWVRVTKESNLASHSVEAAEKKTGYVILGLRRDDKDYIQPAQSITLKEGDELLVVTEGLIFNEVQPSADTKRILLVDDNPVICRLYTRLFQKAGYAITTAENGETALKRIISENPHVAVIDYHLPDISGLEVCRRIRQNSGADSIKLVLFTADEQEETREKALAAGVETVVLKSPDASEIISIVQKILED